MDAFLSFVTGLPGLIASIVSDVAAWSWDHRWWSVVAVLVVGGAGTLLTFANTKDRQVRDLWRNR